MDSFSGKLSLQESFVTLFFTFERTLLTNSWRTGHMSDINILLGPLGLPIKDTFSDQIIMKGPICLWVSDLFGRSGKMSRSFVFDTMFRSPMIT